MFAFGKLGNQQTYPTFNHIVAQKHHKAIITNILTGKGTDAQLGAVAVNVALLMRLFGHEDLKANTQKAIEAMNSGKAYELVKQLANHA